MKALVIDWHSNNTAGLVNVSVNSPLINTPNGHGRASAADTQLL